MATQRPVQISFDETNRIRLLPPDQFQQTESLADECDGFVAKIQRFQAATASLTGLLSAKAKKIEQEKLLAIGQRNRVFSAQETRRSETRELQALIRQKQMELERKRATFESLKKVEAEQRVLIEKLTKGD